MKRTFKALTILLVAVAITSCGLTSYVSKNVNTTEVCLNRNNFRVVGTVDGTSHSVYVLGFIGGLSKRAVKENALADMYSNAMLTGSQAVVNITEKTVIRNYVLCLRYDYIVNGTIVEFTE